jgi:hypothetical protein
MELTCGRCGTTDFAVPGKAFESAFACDACGAVMCVPCTGRELEGDFEVLCCYRCRSRGLGDAFRSVRASVFDLPPRLARLIADGVWPSAAGPSMTEQQFQPTIPAERVRRFAENERCICFQPPPFPTLAHYVSFGPEGFWERHGALDQIDPARAIVIGDFGHGADSVVILDYARDAVNPPVLRLRWRPRGVGNQWVQGARDFDEFAAMLGLGPRHAEPSHAPDCGGLK